MANYLLVNYNFFPFAAGGTEHYVLEQSKYLKAQGHSTVVVAPIEADQAKSYSSFYSDDHIKVFNYEFEGQTVWSVLTETPRRMDLYEKNDPGLKKSFYNFFVFISKSLAFTNLELHGFTACFGLHFLQAFKQVFPVSPLRYYHHIPVNCPKHTLENSGKECRVEITQKNCTVCIQNTFKDGFYFRLFNSLSPAYFSFLPSPFNRKFLIENAITSFRHLMEEVQEIIVFSDDMAGRLNKDSKVRMIRHGIKSALLGDLIPERNEQMTVFSYLGRIEEIKGITTLIKAWLMLPVLNTRKLRIAGDVNKASAPLRERLQQLSKREDVELVGYVKEGIRSFLGSTHCLIVPSEWYETGPMVIHEAVACGANIIGSDFGGVKELCSYYNQIIFTAYNEKELADKIENFQYNKINEHLPITYSEHFSKLFNLSHN